MKILKTNFSPKKDILTYVGVFAISAFVAASAIYLYSPVISSHAANSDDTPFTVGYYLNPTINISTDVEEVAMTGQTNTFVYQELGINITTNSEFGYSVTIEDVDDNTNLVSTTEGSDSVIASDFEGSVYSSDMENNKWGYANYTGNYKKIPTRGHSEVFQTLNKYTPNPDRATVYFGAKIGPSLESGTYEDEVLITAYVNGHDGQPFDPDDPNNTACDDPTKMQCFVCTRDLEIGESTILMDKRDNDMYRVARLKDGECWMTENLRFGGTDPITLTPELSDVDEEFVVPGSSLSSFTTNIDTRAFYIDPTYGGYYNYYTATAGTITSADTYNYATGSVCPKNWNLVLGGGDTPYSSLLHSSELGYGSYDAAIEASRLQKGGYIDNGNIISRGTIGYYWADASHGADAAYAGIVTADDINFTPLGSSLKYYGYNVRCWQTSSPYYI